MTRPMIITLTPDIESGLVEQARSLGITPEQLAIDSLRERFTPPVAQVQQPKPEETLADFLSDHIGILHGNDIDPASVGLSDRSSDKYAALLVEEYRRWQSGK